MNDMGITYKKLFKMLIDREMMKKTLPPVADYPRRRWQSWREERT